MCRVSDSECVQCTVICVCILQANREDTQVCGLLQSGRRLALRLSTSLERFHIFSQYLEKRSIFNIFPILREQMAQPTLPIPSGAAKISCFDRINGQKMTFASEKVDFSPQNEMFSFVALVQSCMEVQTQSLPPWRRLAKTWQNHQV